MHQNPEEVVNKSEEKIVVLFWSEENEFLFKNAYLFFFYAYECLACMHDCAPHMIPEESIRCPGTKSTDGCELLCEWWESNPGPL